MSVKNFIDSFNAITEEGFSEHFRKHDDYQMYIMNDEVQEPTQDTIYIDIDWLGQTVDIDNTNTPQELKSLADREGVDVFLRFPAELVNNRSTSNLSVKQSFLRAGFKDAGQDHHLMDDAEDPETFGEQIVFEQAIYSPKFIKH